MSWSKRKDKFQFSLIILWLVFTVTFAIWWFKFSLENIELLSTLQPDLVEHWARQRRMILYEGSTWLILLVLGGMALIAFARREHFRGQRIREFFASFSHEVKTSLASLRLQAESLKDEAGERSQSPVLDRLIGDTVRLQVQLENSLFLASQDNLKLYLEPLSLKQTAERVREQWPHLNVRTLNDATVMADERALRSVLSNLFQNAIVHGKSSAVELAVDKKDDLVVLDFRDNGSGYRGDSRRLGELFHRPVPSSGSGIGLFICRLLMKRMNGELEIPQSSNGFHARLHFVGPR